MNGLKRLGSALLAFALVACTGSAAAAYELRISTEVDLELVLAVDVSDSINRDEGVIQRRGYIEALRHPDVVRTIMGGRLQRIAVAYFEWAGASQQRVLVHWYMIDGPESADAFAAALQVAPLMHGRAQGTSVSAAIGLGAELIQSNAFQGDRKVIDISGDGLNTSGPPVAGARDLAVAEGLVINGLPLRTDTDAETIIPYYADCVTGGPGSFMVPVTRIEEFAEAIRQKLVREIAGRADAAIIPADAETPADCMVGEKLRDSVDEVRQLMKARDPVRFVERFYEDGYLDEN